MGKRSMGMDAGLFVWAGALITGVFLHLATTF